MDYSTSAILITLCGIILFCWLVYGLLSFSRDIFLKNRINRLALAFGVVPFFIMSFYNIALLISLLSGHEWAGMNSGFNIGYYPFTVFIPFIFLMIFAVFSLKKMTSKLSYGMHALLFNLGVFVAATQAAYFQFAG